MAGRPGFLSSRAALGLSGRPMSSARAKIASLALAAAALLCAAAPFAQADLTQHGDLFITFNGSLTPATLPRHTLVPIGISVEATIRVLTPANPTALRRIEIAINRDGRLDTRGLPSCPISRIEATSPAAALAACRSSLVGSGSFTANATFPEQTNFPSSGQILAFNSTVGGHRAILAHVYGTEPVPSARILTFHLRSSAGTYGTVLSAALPKSVNNSGYLKSIKLRLHRLFRYRGHLHSYLSAACAAPPGFPGATFPLARASMTFAGPTTLTSTVIRSCRVSR